MVVGSQGWRLWLKIGMVSPGMVVVPQGMVAVPPGMVVVSRGWWLWPKMVMVSPGMVVGVPRDDGGGVLRDGGGVPRAGGSVPRDGGGGVPGMVAVSPMMVVVVSQGWQSWPRIMVVSWGSGGTHRGADRAAWLVAVSYSSGRAWGTVAEPKGR